MKNKLLKLCAYIGIALLCLCYTSCDLFFNVQELETPQIFGNISLPTNSNLLNTDIWVKESISNKIAQVDANGNFLLNGLNENCTYDLYFSDTPPETFSKSNPKTEKITNNSVTHYGAKVSNVKPSTIKDLSMGTVPIIKVGSISGNVKLNNTNNYDNSGIKVYISDTSFYTLTDESGNYTLQNIPQGKHQISFEKNNYKTKNSEEIILKENNSNTDSLNYIYKETILYPETGSISGMAYIEGLESRENIQISVISTSTTQTYTSTTDEQGAFILHNILPDTYVVNISYPNYSTYITNEITVEKNKNIEIKPSIVLKNYDSGNIIGNIIDTNNSPIEDVQIIAYGDDGSRYITSSLKDGTFYFNNVKPATFTLSFKKDGFIINKIHDIKVINNAITTIEDTQIKIKCGTIEGVATLEGATNHEGIFIELIGTNYNTKTDSEGHYSLVVPIGEYTKGLKFLKEDYKTESKLSSISVSTESIYNINPTELTCEKTTLQGTVNITTSDNNSNVKVSIKNLDYSLITKENGEIIFPHVPLGDYTLIIELDNNTSIEKQITLTPGLINTLEEIKITPHIYTATILGNATLDGCSNNSNILVSAIKDGTDIEYSTHTDSTGYFELSNIPIDGRYKITFSKNGWVSHLKIIEDLVANAQINITPTSPIILVDIDSPTLKYFSINSGNSFTSNREVSLTIDASDNGSGLEYLQISFNNNFNENLDKIEYKSPLNITLPNKSGLQSIYLRVLDKAGNISNIIGSSINLLEDSTEISGNLDSNQLHWIESNSPYLITDNIYIEKGKTLIIDPGVEVIFKGPYAIYIEGSIYSVGEKNNLINFYSINEEVDNWLGIICSNSELKTSGSYYNPIFESGNLIKNAKLLNCKNGLIGNIFADNTTIIATSYSLLDFTGVVKNSDITGSIINTNDSKPFKIINSNITSKYINTNIDINFLANYFGYFINNIITNIDNSSKIGLCTTSILATHSNPNLIGYNNTIIGFEYCDLAGSNNTFKNINNLYLNGNRSLNYSINNTYEHCNFATITDRTIKHNSLMGSYDNHIESFSNFINCGIIKTTFSIKKNKSFDFTHNYWGDDNSNALNQFESNLDFFDDYYDNYNYSKINYSNWNNKEFKQSGHLGNSYIGFNITDKQINTNEDLFILENDKITPVKSFKFKIMNDNIGETEIEKYRVVQDLSLLTDESKDSLYWKDYPNDGICVSQFGDKEYYQEDVINLYIQVKDNKNNISGIKYLSNKCIDLGIVNN